MTSVFSYVMIILLDPKSTEINMTILKTLCLTTIILTQTGCVTTSEQEVGTVVGSSLIGAAVGALGGAALNSYGSGGYYRGYRPNYAINGAFAGAATGAVIGLSTVNSQRQAYAQQQQMIAQEAAARAGSTRCTSRMINDNGIIRETETCDAQVQRPGYQSW